MLSLIFSVFRFPRRQWPTLIAIGVLLPLASLSLQFLGYVRTQRIIECLGRLGRSPRDPSLADIEQAQRLAALTRIAGNRHPLPASCLRQSLVLSLLLRIRGFAAPIRLGVATTIDRAPAHAWVELGGVALDPQAVGHRMFEPPARGRQDFGPALSTGTSNRRPRAVHGSVAALLMLALGASAIAGLAPWAIRASLVVPSWPGTAETAGSFDEAGVPIRSCPAPWSRPRPDAMAIYEGWLAFGAWPSVARISVDLALLGLLGFALARLRREKHWRRTILCSLPLLALMGASALRALIDGHVLDLASGGRASLPWLLGAVAVGIATRNNLRALALSSVALLALQGVLAIWELDSYNSPYGTALLGLQIHRLVGTFEVPAALGAFAVLTWAMAFCWLEPPGRIRLLLTLLVILVLLACSSASAWVAFAATSASTVFFRLTLRRRLVLLGAALPLAIAVWMALPGLTGRADVHDSLWGRVTPALEFSREHLDTTAVLWGYRFGVGTHGHEPLRLLVSERVEPPSLRPPTDSTPAVLFWQVGLIGAFAAYASMLLALAMDRRSRPVGIALLVGSFFVSVTESTPLGLALALWLAVAARAANTKQRLVADAVRPANLAPGTST